MTNEITTYREPDADYRIYVACLADYSNGVLHGAFIDCDGKDADELEQEVNVMLLKSEFPNVTRAQCKDCEHIQDYRGEEDTCDVCGGELKDPQPSAEEYAIHDHDGFGDLIGEYTPLSEVASIVEALEEADDADALKVFAGHYGYVIREAVKHFGDAYCGQWRGEREYAEDLIEGTGGLVGMPEYLQSYFDYESFARDLFMGDYTFVDGYVFNDNH
jgi:antirestriction protein